MGEEYGLSDVFARNGIQALRDVLRKSTGIAIDGAVEVDFAGLVGVTDAVGGIDLCVPRRAVSEHTGRIFEPGCRHFTEILGVIAAGGDAVRLDSGGLALPALFRTVREMKNTTVVSISALGGLRPAGAQLWAAVRGVAAQWVAATPKQVDQR